MKTFYLLASDQRFDKLGEFLKCRGFRVERRLVGTPASDAVFFFPLGADTTQILPYIAHAHEGSVLFTGWADEALKSFAERRKFKVVPVMEHAVYRQANARHTAEGVLGEVIARIPLALGESVFLVGGYGYCGKAIAHLLWLCGSEVWVWARGERAQGARADGFNVVEEACPHLAMFDGVINTIPAPVYTQDILETLRRGTTFFQVATGNSGISPQVLERKGVSYAPLPALPAKVASESESAVLWQVIKESLASHTQNTDEQENSQ